MGVFIYASLSGDNLLNSRLSGEEATDGSRLSSMPIIHNVILCFIISLIFIGLTY